MDQRNRIFSESKNLFVITISGLGKDLIQLAPGSVQESLDCSSGRPQNISDFFNRKLFDIVRATDLTTVIRSG
jgi:hypothetical protein